MSSFNAFTQKKMSGTGNLPIWLGTVRPRPVGGVIVSNFLKANMLIPAGAPVCLSSGVIYPLISWKVVSVDSSTHAITILPNIYGILPSANDFITPIGATFATTGAAGKVSSVAAGSTAGQWVITFTDAKLDGVSEGSYLAPSSADAVGTSGKSIANQPNGYLGHDIAIEALINGETLEYKAASGDVVDFHGEGILIDRTESAPFKAQMKAAVPNVIQVEY